MVGRETQRQTGGQKQKRKQNGEGEMKQDRQTEEERGVRWGDTGTDTERGNWNTQRLRDRQRGTERGWDREAWEVGGGGHTEALRQIRQTGRARDRATQKACGVEADLSLGNSHLESRGRSYSDTSVNSEDSRRRPVV